MVKNILILGASGTVGTVVFKQLSYDENIKTVGTSDVIIYQCFIEQLIAAMDMKRPEFIFQKNSGVMAD